MAKKPDREEVMLDLVQRYDKARLIAKEAKNEADELNSEIKAILADKEELPLPGSSMTSSRSGFFAIIPPKILGPM